MTMLPLPIDREGQSSISEKSAALPIPRRRLPSLDGFRAISIFFVVAVHASATADYPSILTSSVLDSALGVRIFFVISGFLITTLLLEEDIRAGRVSLHGFYRRRFIRILPVYWCYLLTVAVLGWAGVLALRWTDLAQPLTFTNGFWFWENTVTWVTRHTWSLAIEEHFYLVWPTIFVLLDGPRMRIAVIAMVLVATPLFRCWVYLHPRESNSLWTILGHADMIGWGCFLSLVAFYFSDPISRILQWRPAVGRALAVLVIEGSPWYFSQVFRLHFVPLGTLWMTAHGIAIAYLLASFMTIRRGVVYKLLNSWLAVQIGILSYSIYIWQQLFLAPSVGRSGYIWQKWPLNIACVIAVASASFYLVERPLLRFKRKRGLAM